MSIKNPFSTIQISRRKKKVIKTILSSPQQHQGVVNVHSIDRNNIGDFYCAPHHYFEQLRGTEEDIFSFKKKEKEVRQNFIKKVNSNAVIVGGGGLLNRGGFKRQMKLFEDLTAKGKKVVLWGVGHNEKDPEKFGRVKNYNVNISKFGLAGVRDFSMPGEYVPCVSCLHSIFDETHIETQEIGIVFHKDTIKRSEVTTKFIHYPTTSNNNDLGNLIKFIGSSENIITDSYHAMYWAMLLGKKVVTIPNSSKFYDFRYKPIISNFENCVHDVKRATKYSGILEECRSINMKFARKVFDYLEIE